MGEQRNRDGAIISEKRAERVNRKYHQTEVHVSKSARGLLYRVKKENDSRNLHRSEHLKNGTVSVQTQSRKPSVETIYSVPSTHKRRNTICSAKKPPIGRRCIVKNVDKLVEPKQRIDELGKLVGKEPRSYAQLIASYNEAIYGTDGMGNQKDGFNCVINGIRRSPFSTTTATTVSTKWKNKHKGNKNGNICSTGFNVFNQDAKFSSEAAPKYNCQYDGGSLINNIEEKYNEFERTYLSYATVMEKYSDTLNLTPDMLAPTHLIHKRNVSTKLDEILLDSKSVDKMDSITGTKNSGISERISNQMEMQERDNWMTKVDDVIKDLKRITSKIETSETKTNDSWMLQSVKERAQWLDRVVQAHKKSIVERKTNENAKTTLSVANESESEDLPFTFMANEKSSNSITGYMKRDSVSSNSSPYSSSQTPTKVSAGSSKEPQIELRMTPSQNESIVSINYDEQTTRTAGSNNSEQLSVVISSKKNPTSSATANQNPRSDFGTMQISISETTVPVKQLEFSINGKPVSELKSIVARSDKLDVVSSMDKVEIRIPSKNGASLAATQARSNIAATAKPVLNLQIAAKFNEPRFQQPRGAEIKTETPHMTPPSQPTQPKTPPVPRAPPVPTRPPRTHNFFNADSIQSEPANIAVSKEETLINEASKMNTGSSSVTNAKEAENMAGTKRMGTFSRSNTHTSVRTDETVLKTLSPSQTTKPSDPVIRISTSATEQTNKQNRTDSDNRVATTIIPWWSSDASFTKIRKKENLPKNLEPFQSETIILKQPKQSNAQQLGQPSNASQEIEQTKEHVSSASQKVEQKLHTETAPVQKQDTEISKIQKVEESADNQAAQAAVESSSKNVQPDTASIARVRCSQWPSKQGNRTTKKTKYRVRSSLHGRKVSPRAKNEAPYVAAHPPKVIKYVPLEPQRVNVEKKFESTEKPIAEGQPKTAQKVESQKLETESTKIERSVVHGPESQIGQTNVQNSNTLLKEENELKGDVNKSADVSAKPTSPTSKLATTAGKEGKQPERDVTTKKSLPSKAVDVDDRIKEILKSMKPIEKRKDGTLIDFGVIVPSRRPSMKVRQIPKIPTGNPAKAPEREPTSSSQDKIVEPEKVSSTKKQMLTEPKNTVEQPKIVEPEKISSVKKEIGVTTINVKYETKANNETQAKQLQTGKPVTETVEQKNAAKTEKSNLVANKSGTSSIFESKPSISNPKQTSSVSSKPVPKRPNTANVLLGENSSNQSVKASQKSSEGTVKSSRLERPKTVSSGTSKNLERKEAKTVLKPAKPGKAPLEGTIPVSSRAADKTKKLNNVSKIDLQKSTKSDTEANAKVSTKTTKPDDSSLKISATDITELEKNKSRTGMAPFEGTILRPPKHPDSLSKLLNVNEERKVSADLAKQKRSDFFKFTKKPPNKGGGGSGTESSGPVGTLRGPGGPRSQYDGAETPVTCTENKQHKNPSLDEDSNGACILFSSEREMPVKNILYTSWLQRFKKKYDDDKTVQ